MSDQRIEETEPVSADSTDEPTETSEPSDSASLDEAGSHSAEAPTDAEPEAGEGTGEAAAKDADENTETTEATEDREDGEDGEEGSRRPGGRKAQLVREGEVAADFLENLLDICDLDGDLDVDIDGDRAAVAIVDSEDGRVPRRLVGPDGQVLEALQELTRLAVQSETGERSRLMLDVAGHRAERRAALVALAKEAVAEVKESGEAKSLSPMTAFERKVVHDEVLASGLVSESEGSEPRRYVVISPSA
ncbi:R3H domain-containing nucleic acid-binding protein [uncultured Phycicoccus sp.]|uniref:Jag family protein n=1 Tax=uncultured Phycicoccus sp. TaxID=661422 RepID=UPI002636461D|nr:R3H domain-containing nucleic acid-binding protein [uncultured Phycicoccus sp.]